MNAELTAGYSYDMYEGGDAARSRDARITEIAKRCDVVGMAWIPQTAFDSVWSFFEFRTQSDLLQFVEAAKEFEADRFIPRQDQLDQYVNC